MNNKLFNTKRAVICEIVVSLGAALYLLGRYNEKGEIKEFDIIITFISFLVGTTIIAILVLRER